MKKANNTFGFPTLVLLVPLLLCKARKEWVYLLFNWYFSPPKTSKMVTIQSRAKLALGKGSAWLLLPS